MALYQINKLCLLLTIVISTVTARSQPNIIVIVADDLGWNDLSFHGSPQIPTPNIDYLAKHGIILNNYYVCPVCSPSRGSLMTGLYPIHTGLQHSVIFVNEPWGLPLNLTILPQHLKKIGYTAHAVGKWHLGYFRKEYTPTYRGFDSHYGYWGGKEDYFDHTQQMGEMWGLDFHHNMTSVHDGLGKYSTSLFTKHAVNVINQHNTSKPLFLYLAYQAVHSANSYAPLQAPAEYVARFPNIKDKNRRTFAGMVSAMDDGVNLVMKSLRSRNMLKNSIVIFTTDNGGPAAGFNDNAASNWPLRGVKATLWEGGVRGAAFIWSPLLKNSGYVSLKMMHITDWLPTLYHVAGGNVKQLGNLDGYNMWDALSRDCPSPRKEVLLNIDPISSSSALRVRDYKVILGKQFNGNWNGWYGPSGRESFTMSTASENNYVFEYTSGSSTSYVDKRSSAELVCGPMPQNASTNCFPAKEPCLFNVKNDPCEYYNLADKQKPILAQLLSKLSAYAASAVPPGNKPLDPRSAPKYHNYEWINWKDPPYSSQ